MNIASVKGEWNRYQERITSKICKGITRNDSLFQSQQQTQHTNIQKEEIKVSMNLPYVKGTTEKLQRILRSQKIRSTFYTENALHKLRCKLTDRETTDKKKISCMKMTIVTAKQSTWVN